MHKMICPVSCIYTIHKRHPALLQSANDYKLFFNLIILSSISRITLIKPMSSFPVGSSSPQLSSKGLPIKGHPTLHPIEIAMSTSGIYYLFILPIIPKRKNKQIATITTISTDTAQRITNTFIFHILKSMHTKANMTAKNK